MFRSKQNTYCNTNTPQSFPFISNYATGSKSSADSRITCKNKCQREILGIPGGTAGMESSSEQSTL